MTSVLDERKPLSEILSLSEDWRGAEVFAEGAKSGEEISASDLKAIRKFTRADIPAEQLYTYPVLAIDDAPTRNKIIYSAQSQRESVKGWVGIPFLFNSTGTTDGGIFGAGADHRLAASSQYARIYKAALVETPSGRTGTLVWVYTARGVSEAVDEFINKLDVGILREVSIHVQAPNGLQCNLCKAPFGEKEKCSEEAHYPGEKTKGGKMCYAETVGAVTPLELSSVACPGSVVAHVMDTNEVPKYKLLSMREAINGSRATLEAIMAEANEPVVTDTTLAETAPELTEEQKAAAAVQLAADEAAAQVTADALAAASVQEAADAAALAEATAAGEAPKPFVIYEGKCVACGRDGKPLSEKSEKKAIKEIREAAGAQVSEIVEAAKTKIDAAEAVRDAATKRAEQFDAVFADVVKEVAGIAVAKGIKTAAQREDYTKELLALDYSAVKVVRETLDGAAVKSDEKRKQVVQTMSERHQKNHQTTQTTTDAEGKTSTVSQRKMFANTSLGPIGS